MSNKYIFVYIKTIMISDNRSKNGEKQLKTKQLSFRNILFTRFTDNDYNQNKSYLYQILGII